MTRGAPAAGRGATGRPLRIASAAAWLALQGAQEIYFAPLLPAAPPVSVLPWPPLHVVLGGISVVAAFGVWGLLEWGRWLGVASLVAGSMYALGRAAYLADSSTVLATVTSLGFSVLIPAVFVLLLVATWPRREGRP